MTHSLVTILDRASIGTRSSAPDAYVSTIPPSPAIFERDNGGDLCDHTPQASLHWMWGRAGWAAVAWALLAVPRAACADAPAAASCTGPDAPAPVPAPPVPPATVEALSEATRARSIGPDAPAPVPAPVPAPPVPPATVKALCSEATRARSVDLLT